MGCQSTPSSSIQPISPTEFMAASTKSPPHSRHFELPFKLTASYPLVAQPLKIDHEFWLTVELAT
jgi:hypothetical protein